MRQAYRTDGRADELGLRVTRLLTGLAIVAGIVLAVTLAQGIGEAAGNGIVERLVR